MSSANGKPLTEVPLTRVWPLAYLVLQGAGAGLLLVSWLLWKLLQPLLLPSATDFGTSWTAAFILVPMTFLPALVWWNSWVNDRYGRRPRAWRVAAEVAFALQVVATLVLQGIA
jgi:predicted membrane-bound mannosyltransferase